MTEWLAFISVFLVVGFAFGLFVSGVFFIVEAISGFWFEASRAIRRWRRGQR